MYIKSFTFNDFQENTYLLYDDTKECIIIDPGCNGTSECQQLSIFIENNQLKPKRLINTHCHIDHVLGNAYVANKYSLILEAHSGEIPVLESGIRVSQMYGIPYQPSPHIGLFLDENMIVDFGHQKLSILFCPGHSPASICLYNEIEKQLIAGDVLFNRSIGRTDLPGGDYDTLINSIQTQLMTLPDDVVVYSGHGIPTTIGEERNQNPFLT
jgi:hydroxyacylglutathione hydrolase